MAARVSKKRRLDAAKPVQYACERCTYVQPTINLRCAMCGTSRPLPTTTASANIEMDIAMEHDVPDTVTGHQGPTGWPKPLGEIIALGYANRSGSNLVSAGEQVTISRVAKQQPKLTSAKKLKKGASVSQKLPFGRTKSVKDTIVRFSCRGVEIGRVPSDVVAWMAPLLDAGTIEVTGVVVDAPAKLKLGTECLLQLTVMVPYRACSTKTDAFDVDTSQEDMVLAKATMGMLKALGLYKTSGTGLEHHATSSMPSTSEDEAVVVDEEGGLQDITDGITVKTTTTLRTAEPAPSVQSTLRHYQKQGLAWLMDRENLVFDNGQEAEMHPMWASCHFTDKMPLYWNLCTGAMSLDFPQASTQARGGILADAMGLGKTVQALALIASAPAPVTFTDLVQPSTHVEAGHGGTQSLQQLLQSSGAKDPIQGQGEEVKASKPRSCPATLIVCPMSLLSQWKSEVEAHVLDVSVHMYYGAERTKSLTALCQYDIIITTYGTVSSDFANRGQPRGSPLFDLNFWRVLLDEAHMIKCRSTTVARACFSLSAERRWALTGTPIQNKLEGVFSLLHFLRVQPWSIYSYWREHIELPYINNQEDTMKHLQNILSHLLLRRTKDTLDEHGQPILTLPSSDVEVVKLTLSPQEQEFYESLESRSRSKFSEFQAAGTVMSNYANILELLLRLRQACDHPFLTLKQSETKLNLKAHTFSDIDQLLSKFLNSGTSSLTKDYASTVAQELKQSLTGSASEDVVCIASECPICLDQPFEPVITPCAHVGCQECIVPVVTSLAACPVCREPTEPTSLVRLTTNEAANEKGAQFSKSLSRAWKPSTKVNFLVDHVQGMLAADPSDKCIIFSQWTSMLDLIEIAFKKEGIPFLRLDGAQSQAKRAQALEQFAKDDSFHVFLISLRSGGVGLNLTAASHVILCDPWWNPATEEQAIDRVHRIGQEKPVKVKRLIIEGSVEDKMLKIQKAKKDMANGALSKTGGDRTSGRLHDLRFLLNF